MSETPRTDAVADFTAPEKLFYVARELERELFIQTESAKQLGRMVRDKDDDRIFFRDRSRELLAALKSCLDHMYDSGTNGSSQAIAQARAAIAKAES